MAMTDWRKQHEYELALAKLEQARDIIAEVADQDQDDPDHIGRVMNIDEMISELKADLKKHNGWDLDD